MWLSLVDRSRFSSMWSRFCIALLVVSSYELRVFRIFASLTLRVSRCLNTNNIVLDLARIKKLMSLYVSSSQILASFSDSAFCSSCARFRSYPPREALLLRKRSDSTRAI